MFAMSLAIFYKSHVSIPEQLHLFLTLEAVGYVIYSQMDNQQSSQMYSAVKQNTAADEIEEQEIANMLEMMRLEERPKRNRNWQDTFVNCFNTILSLLLSVILVLVTVINIFYPSLLNTVGQSGVDIIQIFYVQQRRIESYFHI